MIRVSALGPHDTKGRAWCESSDRIPCISFVPRPCRPCDSGPRIRFYNSTDGKAGAQMTLLRLRRTRGIGCEPVKNRRGHGRLEAVDHWRLLSRAAREGGLRGILYDAEPYTPPHSQFLYGAQPENEKHSFAEYRVRARQRGREVMQAVADEYPQITILTYRLFCDVLPVLDAEAACLTAMANGCFGQNVPVQPGETYAVRVRVRTEGRTYAALGIGWKTAEERWSWASLRSLAASGAGDADGWREVVGLVTVPPEARYLVVMLATRGQSRDADRVWFDDAQLVKMED